MRSICRFTCLILVLALSACNFSKTPAWLRGDWTIDVDASQKAAADAPDTTPTSGPLEKLGNAMVPMILSALSGLKMTVTDKEIMVYTSNGNGKATTYEVVSTVPNQECQVQKSDGTLSTFYKSGDEIYVYPDQGPKIKLFFKRNP